MGCVSWNEQQLPLKVQEILKMELKGVVAHSGVLTLVETY